MSLLQILILAFVQGICELLPVSSSAHVLVAAKLLGIEPTSPEMTFLLVMLHTGTMFAVIVYFWRAWRQDYFSSAAAFWTVCRQIVIATVATAIIGGALLVLIEKVILRGQPHAEIEHLFGNFRLIAAALAAVGVLILLAGRGRMEREAVDVSDVDVSAAPARPMTSAQCGWMGAVQGLCLPFRGFSRSGATISTGLLLGVPRLTAEKFSFALAVVLTPPVIAREALRLVKARHAEAAAAATTPVHFGQLAVPGLIGMAASFVAGLLALRWLSAWLERGRWQWFGVYCLVAAVVLFFLAGRWV